MIPRITTHQVLDAMRELEEAQYNQLARYLGHDVDEMDLHRRQRILQKLRDKVYKLRTQDLVDVVEASPGLEEKNRGSRRRWKKIILTVSE